jgi:1-acyl-sn-glycerol-3-phosphate acyltransferase
VKLPKDASLLWKSLWVVATVLRPLFCRLRLEGVEHVPLAGGCILTCNHTMGPDYVFLGYASPRQIYYMAKSEAFQIHPWLTKILWAAGVFPVRRGQQDLEAIEQAVRLVQAGCILGMFPEGTRSRTGQLQRGKSGAARIAMQARAPVVPAVVINSVHALKRPWWRLRRPEVIVRFGKPLYWLNHETNSIDAAKTFTNAIMGAMAALLPPELRGEYTTQMIDTFKVCFSSESKREER